MIFQNRRKSQVVLEFIFLFIFATLFVSFVILFLRNQQLDLQKRVRTTVADDFVYSLQQEFFSASTMHQGYVREIILPEKINGRSYNVSIITSNLYFEQDGFEKILPLPSTVGNILDKTVTIKLINNQVVVS